MKKILFFALLFVTTTAALAQRATVRINAQNKHQHITGFGGFVCSPQFTYNHMSTSDINKVWGKGSTVGCNIMRLYIPIGRNAWSQSLQTAKNAKEKGLIIFASPWGQPAEWKTNGTSNAKNSDGTIGYLKKENWPDYAQYLEDYVQYLRNNGVELDAISIQNEPDWPAEYAGCIWSAAEIAEFVKTYGKNISCKVMAPETLAVSDSYANALNNSDVLDCFDIYGGHQYGGIQSAYKKLGQQGKEIWMTEYLINWNENQETKRSFDFSKDFFDFFRAINVCMLGDFNAWIHYAAKRYYGMLGDGQSGTTTSVVTKRGYVMAHFARFVTGMTRIDATFSSSNLEGSAYLSQTGDTVVAVIANIANEACTLTLDLPFYTLQGKLYTTSKTKNLIVTTQNQSSETCRPQINLAAQSVVTALFIRSRDRQVSNMSGSTTRYDRLDDMTATKTTFGTTYKLSGKTKKFDHSNPLISSRTTDNYGYVKLNNRFDKLVMEVKNVTSTMNYSSSKTTLLYINGNGQLASHDYGSIDFSKRENFLLEFDLSPATLTDGCRGLISITNDNWSSTLTITFGDIYLSNGNGQYAATLNGDYVEDDSNVLDYSTDEACTSISMTAVSQLPTTLPWLENHNRVVYVTEGNPLTGTNIIAGGVCNNLALTEDGGSFRPATAFTANNATFTCKVDGLRLLTLPFNAPVPEGAEAYLLTSDLKAEPVSIINRHEPVLVAAQGEVTFTGSGEVSFATSEPNVLLHGTYTPIPLYAGDYMLTQQNGVWGLQRLTTASSLTPFGAYAQPSGTDEFLPFDLTQTGIRIMEAPTGHQRVYNILGQKVSPIHHGLLIRNGKKFINR